MGLIERILSLVFGDGRNLLKETAEVFRENSEAQAGRDAILKAAAFQQFSAEFGKESAGRFDRVLDGLNRLPRPLLAFGTIGLFVSAMVSPVWFAERMQGIALVPEPLWWILGAIISFYFGARHQAKGQAFQKQMLQSLPDVLGISREIEAGRAGTRDDLTRDLHIRPRGQPLNGALNDWHNDQADQGR